jgi:hypothetical protein
MSSCTSCSSASTAYASAQSYVREQLNNFSKPQQQNTPDVIDTSLNPTGRGQLLNIKA